MAWNYRSEPLTKFAEPKNSRPTVVHLLFQLYNLLAAAGVCTAALELSKIKLIEYANTPDVHPMIPIPSGVAVGVVDSSMSDPYLVASPSRPA